MLFTLIIKSMQNIFRVKQFDSIHLSQDRFLIKWTKIGWFQVYLFALVSINVDKVSINFFDLGHLKTHSHPLYSVEHFITIFRFPHCN